MSLRPWLIGSSSLALVISWTGPSFAQLIDISNYWAAPYIQQLAEQQVLGGFPDGTFRPNDSVTRAQFAAIITKAFGLDTNVPPRQFTDAIPGWAAPAINAAAAAGFISGFPDGTFRANDSLTRAQAMTVLTRAAGVAPIDPAQIETILSIYADNQTIPNFARPNVAAATQAGLIVLYPNPQTIHAARVASRGEVAALTQLALSKAGRLPSLAVPPGAVIPGSPGSLPVEPLPIPTPSLEAPAAPPQIRDFLTRTDLNALRPGTTLDLILLGTPGSRATFGITGVVEGIPMSETRPGQYEGSYTIRTQDRAAAAVIEARLEGNGLVSVTQLPQTLRLGTPQDTTFPTLSALTPANQSTVSTSQPQISAQFRDDQGIDLNSFNLLINNQNVSNQVQISRQGFTFTPARPLPTNRPIRVRAQIADTSGNTSFAEWTFSVTAPVPAATPTAAPVAPASPTPAPPTPTPVPVPPANSTPAPPTPTAAPVAPANSTPVSPTPTTAPVAPANSTPTSSTPIAAPVAPASPSPATPQPDQESQATPAPGFVPPMIPDGIQMAPTDPPQP